MPFRPLCRLVDLEPDSPTAFTEDGERIAVVRIGDEVFAVSDRCTHADWSLCDGYVEGEEIICPLHGARFSLRTGELVMPPGDGPLETYATRIEGDTVYIDPVPREGG